MRVLLEHLAVLEETAQQEALPLSLMELPARLYCKHLVEGLGQEAPMGLTEVAVAVAALVPLAVTLLAQQKVMVATLLYKARQREIH